MNKIFEKLSQSKFRSRFHLKQKDIEYIDKVGLEKIRQHARDFVENRLSNLNNFVDGKQTPTKGHPVFIAQHATATCCRDCLFKWHKIEKGRPLTKDEKLYIEDVIMQWIKNQTKRD